MWEGQKERQPLVRSFTAPYGSLLSAFTLGKKTASRSPPRMRNSLTLFVSIWKCTISLPAFQTFYDTLPAILMWTVRLCLLRAHAGGRDLTSCQSRGDGSGCSSWLSWGFLGAGSVTRGVPVDGDPVRRLNAVWVWESGGAVFSDRPTQETRGRLEQCGDCHFWPPHHASLFTIDCIRSPNQPGSRHERLWMRKRSLGWISRDVLRVKVQLHECPAEEATTAPSKFSIYIQRLQMERVARPVELEAAGGLNLRRAHFIFHA